jgi:hypothetical protein
LGQQNNTTLFFFYVVRTKPFGLYVVQKSCWDDKKKPFGLHVVQKCCWDDKKIRTNGGSMSVQQYWANCSSTVASCSSVAGARMQDIVQCAHFFFCDYQIYIELHKFLHVATWYCSNQEANSRDSYSIIAIVLATVLKSDFSEISGRPGHRAGSATALCR